MTTTTTPIFSFGKYSFTLPLPPPENERLIFDRNHRRFILSKKYREYKQEAQYSLMTIKAKLGIKTVIPSYERQMFICITPYMPNKRRDPHGILKPLLDVMEGTIYENDRWICPIFSAAVVDEKMPRVEIKI